MRRAYGAERRFQLVQRTVAFLFLLLPAAASAQQISYVRANDPTLNGTLTVRITDPGLGVLDITVDILATDTDVMKASEIEERIREELARQPQWDRVYTVDRVSARTVSVTGFLNPFGFGIVNDGTGEGNVLTGGITPQVAGNGVGWYWRFARAWSRLDDPVVPEGQRFTLALTNGKLASATGDGESTGSHLQAQITLQLLEQGVRFMPLSNPDPGKEGLVSQYIPVGESFPFDPDPIDPVHGVGVIASQGYTTYFGDLGIELINTHDIDTLRANLGSADPIFDLDRSGGPAGEADVNFLIHDILRTTVGDADLDGRVNVLGDGSVLVANLGNAGGWGQGDFDGDGLVTVLGDGQLLVANLGFVGPGAQVGVAAAAVPEPGALIPLVACVLPFRRARRRVPAQVASPPQAWIAVFPPFFAPGPALSRLGGTIPKNLRPLARARSH
jgi:hypothetical protein